MPVEYECFGTGSKANFKLDLEKCIFADSEVTYLCHIVSASGVLLDASKVKAIKTIPLPRNVRDIGAFLGLAGYCRSFKDLQP
jgi:hypothetical protein